MGEGTKIEWASDSFNPWVGCEKVSPACANCYAEGWAKRTGNPKLWRGDRRVTADANWRKPLKWNREAEESGEQRRVFCASLADVYEDRDDLVDPRARLWELVESTPALTWLMLTKRPENVVAMTPADLLPRLWVGTTAENQEYLERRVVELVQIPSAIRFLSCEPLLGQLSVRRVATFEFAGAEYLDALAGKLYGLLGDEVGEIEHSVDWLIGGGESGPQARPTHPDWVRQLRDECVETGTAYFWKQWGEWKERFHDEDGPRMRPCADPGTKEGRYLWETATRPGLLSADGRFFASPEMLPDGVEARLMERVGRKAAGRLLDGCEWNEVPEVSA